MWSFGKTIGMEVNGSEGRVVNVLEGMEVRDRLAAGKINVVVGNG